MRDEAQRSGKPLPTSSTLEAAELFYRIDAVISSYGTSKLAADAAGVSVDTIMRWRKGPTMPPFDKIAALCLAAGFSVDWIATGKEPRRLNLNSALPQEGTEGEHGGLMQVQDMEMRTIDLDLVPLPRLSIKASAGGGLIPIDENVEGFIAIKREYLRMIDVSPSHAHIAQLSGNSMKPTLLDRDLIVVDTSKTEVLNEHIYAVVYGETVLAKRIQLLWDGSLKLISDNKADGYTDEVVPASERHNLHIVGRIKSYLRHF